MAEENPEIIILEIWLKDHPDELDTIYHLLDNSGNILGIRGADMIAEKIATIMGPILNDQIEEKAVFEAFEVNGTKDHELFGSIQELRYQTTGIWPYERLDYKTIKGFAIDIVKVYADLVENIDLQVAASRLSEIHKEGKEAPAGKFEQKYKIHALEKKGNTDRSPL